MRQQRGIVLQRGSSLCVIWLGVLALARAGEPSPPAPPQKLRVTLQEIWLPFDRLDRFPDGAEAFGNQANVLRD